MPDGASAKTKMPKAEREVLATAKRLLQLKRAHDELLQFAQAVNPHPDHPDDAEKSRFIIKPHHVLIAEALQEVESGECLRLAISMPPQHGKSELISRLLIAWMTGRKPYKNIMFGTYSQDFANDFGAQVRAIMQHPNYQLIFPNAVLRKDSKAKDYQVTTEGGQLAFLGRGGAGTGKPADIFVVDDPIKDDIEAQSDTIRNAVWQWFTKVAYTRCHATSAIIIVHTRWNEDDLLGRLVDPDHPDHDPEIAAEWRVLNIPAVITDPKLAAALKITLERPTHPKVIREFGDVPMAALWADRFTLPHLATAKRLNPRGFEALYQGNPSPVEGDYFKRAWFKYYTPDELPADLRVYAASDHALSKKTSADYTVLGRVGIDKDGNIYVLSDMIWDKIETDRQVEEMLAMMKRSKPKIELWFAESDNIKKAIGPFLRKRMREEKLYVPILDMSTAKTDKMMRARSIQGRMEMGMVYFPKLAHWLPKAQNEILKFPNAAHDDFVDWLAWIGLGLDSEHSAASASPAGRDTPKKGTFGWLKWQTKRKERRAREGQISGGW
jgi:predicted phage terminase large subunit-like protein